ncbi:hypothetical protein [Streptomyces caelestis]
MEQSGDAAELLTRLARGSANVLVTGRPGSGKSTLLRSLAGNPEIRRFRFYFDLGLKPKDEPFSEYAARLLAPAMTSDRSRAYELFLYLIRSGTALCVLDAVDEGVEESSPAGFLRLFTDLAAVLSAESAVVMSSRVAFLADSPQVRQLLDSGAGRSDTLRGWVQGHPTAEEVLRETSPRQAAGEARRTAEKQTQRGTSSPLGGSMVLAQHVAA